MLVLTRKIGESVTIGDGIKVSVIDIKGRQVRIGIEAPSDMRVHREEVYSRIQEENRRAAFTRAVDMTKLAGVFQKKPEDGPSESGG